VAASYGMTDLWSDVAGCVTPWRNASFSVLRTAKDKRRMFCSRRPELCIKFWKIGGIPMRGRSCRRQVLPAAVLAESFVD